MLLKRETSLKGSRDRGVVSADSHTENVFAGVCVCLYAHHQYWTHMCRCEYVCIVVHAEAQS